MDFSANFIEGKVTLPPGAMSVNATCTEPTASLYEIDTDGVRKNQVLVSSSVNASTGVYRFENIRSKGIRPDKDLKLKYMIEVETCNNKIYQRIITSLETQDISYGSDLISQALAVSAFYGQDLANLKKEEIASFMAKLDLISATDTEDLYDQVVADAPLSAEFTTLFGIPILDLKDALPKMIIPSIGNSYSEANQIAGAVSADHWYSSYDLVYDWKWENNSFASTSSINKTLGKNEQGVKSLKLLMGQNNGSGGVDLTKPYYSKTWSITVANNFLPTPPALSLTPAIVTSANINLDLDTGVGMANCETFSSLALTENTATVPAANLFTISCTAGTTQVIPFTLAAANGTKNLRLWAKDAAGNISILPQTLMVTLDDEAPELELTNFNSGEYKAGSVHNITWTATDSGTGVATNGISIEYSTDNGANWNTVALSQTNSGTYPWTLPNVNSSQMLVRITATDAVGNSSHVDSSANFTIDKDAPSLSLTSFNSGAFKGGTTQDITWTSSDAGVGLIATPIKLEYSLDNGSNWADLALNLTNTGTYSWNIPSSINSTQVRVRVSSTDKVGNVATASSSSAVTIDSSGPTLALTSFNTGSYVGGSLQSVTWTASDSVSGFGVNPINLSYSEDGGVNWTVFAAATANDGTEAWGIPSINNNNFKVRVRATDAVGNISEAISSGTLTLDISAPVITSTVINDGATYAGTALIGVKVAVTDNYSSGSGISIRLANAHGVTSECQSEYADNNWQAYTNTTTAIGFTIIPVDGTKKICAWAKDTAGNVTMTSPVAGTDGVDTDSILFEIGNTPSFNSFAVYRTSDSATKGITAGQGMTISYSISDVEGLDNNPVSIAYTTDNTVWKDIFTDQDISTTSNMTWFGGLSGNPTSSTAGVTSWTAPSAGYFRLKAMVKDKAGNTGINIMSNVMNLNRWSIYAGSTDRGDGGVGKSAAIYANPVTKVFAINPKTGDTYAADSGLGLRKLDAKTGLVSTVIRHGTVNLPDDGVMPTSPLINISGYSHLQFDSKGRLYIGYLLGDGRGAIYQVDFENNHVRRYAGAGWNSAAGTSSLDLAISTGAYTFDEDNSLYFFTYCGGSPLDTKIAGRKLQKLTQNADGSPGVVTDIAGNCTNTTLSTFGVPAINSTIGSTTYLAMSSIAVWNRGQNIYVNMQGASRDFKIINGTIYSATISTLGSTAWLYYHAADGKLYFKNSTGGISKITPSLAGNDGETSSVWFNGDSNSVGCNLDGVSISNYCGNVDIQMSVSNGQIFFADGAVSNNPSNFSIRFVDDQNKIQTLMGSMPLFGDGKDKSVIRGGIAGIYYKKSSEPNPNGNFPEGLYFVDRYGVTFNYIDPATGKMETLWGNQDRRTGGFSTGDTISKNLSMGNAYTGGEAQPLTFDDTGLPWTRANSQLIKIDADKKIIRKTSSAGYWHNLADGADPSNVYMYVNGGFTGITLKGQSMFAMGGAYYSPTGPIDPWVSIKILDFANLTTTQIMGGAKKYTDGEVPTSDKGAGLVKTAPMWYYCGNGQVCYGHYDSNTDRLYFSESNLIRYITTPSNTATATLVTLVTRNPGSLISSITVTPDGSQLWYKVSTSLFCKDISSGKSWCDETTNYFNEATASGLPFGSIANQMTWKDNSTMFVSTATGLILQFNLPTGP